METLHSIGDTRDKTCLIKDIADLRPAGEQSGAWHYDYNAPKRLSNVAWMPASGSAMTYGYLSEGNGDRTLETKSGWTTASAYNRLGQLIAAS